MGLKHLQDYINRDSKMVPYFIDNTKFSEKSCFEMSKTIFDLFLILSTNKFLPKATISDISLAIDNVLIDMSLVNAASSYQYLGYIEDMVLYYFDYCNKCELYEISSNLKNFYEIFLNKKIKDNDFN